MYKDPSELDIELEELEKKMSSKFEGLEPAPLRTEFQAELRRELQTRLEDQTQEDHTRENQTQENQTLEDLPAQDLKELEQLQEQNISSKNMEKNFIREKTTLLSWLKTALRPIGFRGFKRWQAIMSISLVIVLLTTVFWGFGELGLNPEPVQASGLSIEALNADKLGIEQDTAFLLSSSEPLAKKLVQENLQVTPEFAYNLEEQAGSREYKIIPRDSLLSDTIYTFSFDPEGRGQESLSWAFQTKSQFKVLRSLPGKESTHVPTDTGIEVTFSHDNYDLGTLKNFFSISPRVEGTFEKHKKTLVFVPKALQPSTIYTITIKKGLPLSGTSETLREDYVFSFETALAEEEKPVFNFELDTSLTEFSTGGSPVFPVYFYNEYAPGRSSADVPSLRIDLYRYPDHEAFQASLAKRDEIPRWSYVAWNNYREKLNPQFKSAEYNAEFLKADQYSYYILFPEKLETGYYAAEFRAGDCVRQVWFQVSDLAVYLAQGEDSTLFWANDLQTQKPASDVEVIIGSRKISARGDKAGVVLIKDKLMGTKRDYALVTSQAGEILIPLEAWPNWQTKNTAADYWKYLYLDRELYQPEDTVNYWGVLSARGKGGTSAKNHRQEQELTLELMGSDGSYYAGAEARPILSQKITVQNKTYSGSLQLPVLKPGYYYLQLKIEDTILLSRGFEVQTYHKPAYELSLTQDKKAVYAGEKVNFGVKAAFFEGTPLPNLKLNYHLEGLSGSLTTDNQGVAQIPYTAQPAGDGYLSYNNVYFNINANLPEIGEISEFIQLYVFNSKVYLTGEAKREDDSFTFTGKLSAVDLTNINNGQYPSEENFLQEPAVDTLVKASLYQEVWTPVEAGERYDFISKKVVKNYRHEYSTKHLSDFELVTDAQGKVEYTGKINPQYSYYLDLTAEDKEGREFKKRIHLGGSSHPEYQHFFLQADRGTAGYEPGQEVEVTFMVNDKELDSSPQSILFYRGQKFIDSYELSDDPKYYFNFETEHIPNLTVYGVYFDGTAYQESYSLNVPFARETKALAVTIETDQSEYRPGDKVKLKLQVTDIDHKPVKGAQVNLNLVDEALFSLRDQKVDFLTSLYGDYYHLFLQTRKSHDNAGFPGGAESGGEGGATRQDFRDTVLFSTVNTDREGRASTEFELPDNLTSWRVTYHALTEDLQAGSGSSQIPVRLPFFIDLTLNRTYLEGDSPAVILRSFGEKLRSGQAVAYTMKLIRHEPAGRDSGSQELLGQSPNSLSTAKQVTVKSWTAAGTSFLPLDCKLPSLAAGNYSLTVSALSGGFTDSLTLEFEVVESLQERTVTSQEVLSEGMTIQGSKVSPTTVIFSDYEKSQYLQGLYRLAWNNGSRLEQKLAGLEARKLLAEYFPEENFWGGQEDEVSILAYQQPDGGVSILPYGESELALSAQVAAGTSGVFDKEALIHYFYRVLEGDTPEDDLSLALLGLASLGEPVLLQINAYLQEENLVPQTKINLALALLEIGDGAYAQKVFRELIALFGEDLGSSLRINAGSDQDEIIQATTQMALMAARLNQPEKNKLYQYLLENPGKDILNLVEQIQILKYNLKYMEASPASFTYELQGERISKELKDTEIYRLTLLPEDLRQIKICEVEGRVGMISQYNRPISAGEKGKAADLAISRTYLVNDREATALDRTDLVKVVINYKIGDKAPAGLYEVVDILPAGLAHIPRPYNYKHNRTSWDYPVETNGQKLVFQLGKGQDKITYLARVISPGEYSAEGPVLSNIKNSAVYLSGSKDSITIE